MNLPVYLLTAAHLLYAAAGAQRVPLERQLVEAGGRSGRRTCRLYCRVGIGFHLQIHPDGRVNGSHEPSQLSKSCVAARGSSFSAEFPTFDAQKRRNRAFTCSSGISDLDGRNLSLSLESLCG